MIIERGGHTTNRGDPTKKGDTCRNENGVVSWAIEMLGGRMFAEN